MCVQPTCRSVASKRLQGVLCNSSLQTSIVLALCMYGFDFVYVYATRATLECRPQNKSPFAFGIVLRTLPHCDGCLITIAPQPVHVYFVCTKRQKVWRFVSLFWADLFSYLEFGFSWLFVHIHMCSVYWIGWGNVCQRFAFYRAQGDSLHLFIVHVCFESAAASIVICFVIQFLTRW